MTALRPASLLLATTTALAGCVAIGPTVPVTAAPGRSPASFAEDRRACMSLTDRQVQPVANRSVAASLAGNTPGASTPADIQVLYNDVYGRCMAEKGHLVARTIVLPPQAGTPACGLRGLDMPVGTPVQEMTIRAGDQPTIGFSQARTVVTSATVISPPCQGRLVPIRPIGFRYIPRQGSTGIDDFAIRACNAARECSITAMVVSIKP